MSRKAVETTRNISNTSGAGSANKCTVQWWFQTFFKGNESLEGECGDWPQKLTITNWEPSSKLILLQLQEKLLKNSTLTILQSFSIWSELERWKSLISGCLIACKKKLSFWSVTFYSTQQQWTISWSDCDVRWTVDFIQQPVITSSVAGPRSSSKVLSKAKLAPKKRSFVTVWWSAASLTAAFWILAEALHLRSTLSKSDALKTAALAASIGEQSGPSSLHTTRRHHLTSSFSQVGRTGYEVMPHPPHSPDLLPTNHHFKDLDNCLQGKCFHNQPDAENAFQEFAESWSMDFYAMGINKHFSLAKNVLTVMVPILINKDVF